MSATVLNPESAEPMMDINTTPLIDVMLVLLIMFIITIPIQTHAVKLDLPQDQPNQPPPPIDPVKNKIVITPQRRGAVERHAGRPGDRCASISTITTTMRPVPELHLSPIRTRATSWSTRCSPSPSAPRSPRWASSATRPTPTSD